MIGVASVAGVDQNKTFFSGNPRDQFTIYIRTKQILSLRLRSESDDMKPVHISSVEIDERFFPYPLYKRKNEISALVSSGEIKVTQVGKRFYYEVLKPGKIDFSLILTKPLPKDPIYRVMLNTLKLVSLPDSAPSTDYFNLFLKLQNQRPELFFKVDEFAGRVHSPVSNFHRSHRAFILLDGEQTTSLDVATMQPLLLGKILTKYLVNNEYSNWINSGKDIYVELQTKARLKTRDEAKKKFFEILFSKPSNALAKLFGAADWITWINQYKATPQISNPHGQEKPHSNLAWLLQTTEVKVMEQVWRKLIAANILFLPVHDEIIIPISKVEQARKIMSDVLSKEFKYFKISGDKLSEKKVLFTATLSTPATPAIEETALNHSTSTLVSFRDEHVQVIASDDKNASGLNDRDFLTVKSEGLHADHEQLTAVTTRAQNYSTSIIPNDVISLQQFYADVEDNGLIPLEHRNYIKTLWQGVMIYLKNPLQLPLYTEPLERLKQQLSNINVKNNNSSK